jgi:hypothetical protein
MSRPHSPPWRGGWWLQTAAHRSTRKAVEWWVAARRPAMAAAAHDGVSVGHGRARREHTATRVPTGPNSGVRDVAHGAGRLRPRGQPRWHGGRRRRRPEVQGAKNGRAVRWGGAAGQPWWPRRR